ncbi:MAG: SMP-30/gluconolactonase/LRE family protein [Gemmatimonadota bacterium]
MVRRRLTAALVVAGGAALGAEDLYVAEDLLPPATLVAAEGPAVGPDGALYAVNYSRFNTIARITPQGQVSLFATLPGPSRGNGIRFARDGRLFVADYAGHNILVVDAATGVVAVFAHEPRMNQPNDLAIGADDRLYASDPSWGDGTGQLWRVDPDGTVTLLEAGMGTTNGIEVGSDEATLYVNESAQRVVWAYDLAVDGTVSGKRALIRFEDYGLDGMRCDVAGNLYVARYDKGVVAVVSPAGDLVREVALRGRQPTNVAFGGPDGRTVYVTVNDRGNVETFRAERPGRSWALRHPVSAVEAATWGTVKGDR